VDAGGDDGATSGDGDGDGNGDGDGDGAISPYWPWCPEASDYVGGNWAITVEVTDLAIYCSVFDEGRTLEDEYRIKSKLRLIPGTFALPEENGTYPFFLPHCFEFLFDEQPVAEEVGEIQANHSPYNGGMTYRWSITQPMRTGAGNVWEFKADLHSEMDSGVSRFTLNGDWGDEFGTGWQSFMLCKQEDGECKDVRWYSSCHYDNADLQKHTVTFEGGSIELFMRMGWSPASTEPALFISGSGTLDGTLFSQEDFYKLIYNPTHHHFSRDFIVLFDTPISSACGILVQELEPWPMDPLGRVTLVDCDLSEIEERRVTEELFEFLR
jgi:hypothetical protein